MAAASYDRTREHETSGAGEDERVSAARPLPRPPGMTAAARRLIRAVSILARDGRIPKPLRGLVAFGLLPIPGPFDEAALFVVGLLLSAFYREPLRQAWSQAGQLEKRPP